MTATLKQKAFVDFYVTCRNGAEAARRAGYSEKTARQIATENLSKPVILAAIAEKEDELKRELGIDKATVVGEFLTASKVAKSKLDAGAMIRAWVEVSKMLGLYAPEKIKVDIEAADRGCALMAKYDAMSDEELIAIIERRDIEVTN